MKKWMNKNGKGIVSVLVGTCAGAIAGLCVAGLAIALEVTSTDDMRKLTYNNLPSTKDAGLMMKNAQPYQVHEAGSDTYYYRWKSGAGSVLLMKISKSANVWTYEKATDTWANRTTATYSAVNE